jgi:hypothetical protein
MKSISKLLGSARTSNKIAELITLGLIAQNTTCGKPNEDEPGW